MTAEFPPPRTAIVTGGAKRIGAEIVQALLDDGWHVVVHCLASRAEAQARFGAHPAALIFEADLADRQAPDAIVAAAAGLPPLALLVNNASRFEYDSIEDFTAAGWDAHMAINLRAPALLARAFARAVPAGANGLVVNLTDAKLEAPNPDYFSYTIAKAGLAALNELLARVLAPRGIRVCAIAPSVTLVSGPQSRGNFEEVRRLNALGRGVTAADIVAALRFVVASPTFTGQTIVLDGGQRFLGLPRDVQFVETS